MFKSVLASYLSSALAKYFVVDGAKIETSFLSDARITLRDTRVRPKKYRKRVEGGVDLVVSVDGTVNKVTFSWTWSLYRGGGGIRDASLPVDVLSV